MLLAVFQYFTPGDKKRPFRGRLTRHYLWLANTNYVFSPAKEAQQDP